MQTGSIGDNLHEMSNPVFWKNINGKYISKCRLLKILPRVLSVEGYLYLGLIELSLKIFYSYSAVFSIFMHLLLVEFSFLSSCLLSMLNLEVALTQVLVNIKI